MNPHQELCQACPVHEERELRAFLGSIERLPVGPVVAALRNDVYERVRRLRTAEGDQLNQRHDEFLRSLDRLIHEAARSSTVERMALAREAEREARCRLEEQDEAGALARPQWEGAA